MIFSPDEVKVSAFLLFASLACCLECPAEARATRSAPAVPSEGHRALRALCPGHLALAPVFDRAAGRSHLPVALLVAVAACESTCDPRAVGRRGEVGLLQILPEGSAARGTSVDRLVLPAVNLRLGAAHLARWLRICGDLAGALGVFSGRRNCGVGRSSPYAARVLRLFDEARGVRS